MVVILVEKYEMTESGDGVDGGARKTSLKAAGKSIIGKIRYL